MTPYRGGDTLDDIDEELAAAVGLFALTDEPVHAVAERTDVTRWELEDAIEDAGLAEPLGLDLDGNVAEEIDDLLDSHT
jgi:hypothetical protein